MKRGSYKIQDGCSGPGGGKEGASYVWCETAARRPDSSFSACILALLLFFFLCVVIMLAAWPWKAGQSTTPAETDSPMKEGLSAGEKTTVPTRQPASSGKRPMVNDTLHPTSLSANESSNIYTSPTSVNGTMEGKTDTDMVESTIKPGTDLVDEKKGTTTSSEKEVLPVEEKNDTEMVGSTIKPGTHQALVDEKNGTTTSAEKEVLPVEEKNDTEIVGSTIKPGTHQALVEEKEGDTTSEEESKENNCVVDDPSWTPACKSYASHILALMNYSAEPCDNFYASACGGMRGEGGEWIAEDLKELKPKQRILDMLRKHNPSMSSTQKKLKAFIDKCIHYEELVDMEERLKQAKSIINNVGTFLIKNTDNGSIFDLLPNLLLHNFPTIFDIQLEAEDKKKLILKLSLPELISPLGHASEGDVMLTGWKSKACLRKATETPRDGRKEDDLNIRYITYTQCNSNITGYVKEVEEAMKKLKLFEKEDEAKADSMMKDTFSFLEKKLLKDIQENLPNQTTRNVDSTKRPYETIFLNELQNEFSLLDWEALVTKLIGDSKSATLNYEEVNVYYKSYFKDIFKVLEGYPVRDLYNGLLAMFAHEVYYGLVVNRNSCFREDYCFDVASNLMPEAISSLFLSSFQKNQLDEFKSEINDLFTRLKSQLQSEVEAIAWVKDEARDKLLKKISEMRLIDDGGCPLFLDDKYLDEQFKEYPLSSTYIEDAASLMQRLRKKMYGAFNEEPLHEIWSLFVHPFSTKAKAIYELNAIVIPYGVMLQPHTTSNSSRYLQRVIVGSQIAKVMWQHFDNTGIYISDSGHRPSVLAVDVRSSMKAVSDCLEKQYETQKSIKDYEITVKYQLPESLSTNSRLADIGGIHLAFNTLIRNETIAPLPWLSMTKEQLYFFTIAQSMCTKANVYQYAVSMFEEEDLPPFLRVEDIAQNSEEFNKAFSCSAKKDIPPACVPFTLAKEIKAVSSGPVY